MTRNVQDLVADQDTGGTLVDKWGINIDAFLTMHAGNGLPPYALANMTFIDLAGGSGSPRMAFYDGTTFWPFVIHDNANDRTRFTGGLAEATGWVGGASGLMLFHSLGTARAALGPNGLRLGDDLAPRFILDVNDTGAILIASGTTAQRPSAGLVDGLIRYNQTLKRFEIRVDGNWKSIAHTDETSALTGNVTLFQALTAANNRIPYFNGSNSMALLEFIDDDDFSSATSTNLASAESIKAYADSLVAANAIVNTMIASNAIRERHYQDESIPSDAFKDDSILQRMIAGGVIGTTEMAANSVTASILAVSGNGTSGNYLTSAGNGQFTWVAAPTFSLADGSVTEAKLAISNTGSAGQILEKTSSSMRWVDKPSGGGGGSTTLAGLTDVSLSSPADKSLLIRDGSNNRYIDGQAEADSIANEAITRAKLNTSNSGNNGQFLARRSSTQMEWKSIVGLTSGGVEESHLASDSVTTAKVKDEAITEAKLDISNSGSTGNYLRKTSSGMQWAPAPGSGTTVIAKGMANTRSDITVSDLPAGQIERIEVSIAEWAYASNNTTTTMKPDVQLGTSSTWLSSDNTYSLNGSQIQSVTPTSGSAYAGVRAIVDSQGSAIPTSPNFVTKCDSNISVVCTGRSGTVEFWNFTADSALTYYLNNGSRVREHHRIFGHFTNNGSVSRMRVRIGNNTNNLVTGATIARWW